MKLFAWCGLLAAMVLGTCAQDAKEEITKAVKALNSKTNYAWRATVVVPPDAQFKPGPIEGKTEKGGATSLKLEFFDNQIQSFTKGEKGALKTDEGWKSLDEQAKEQGPGAMIAGLVKNTPTPGAEAAELITFCKDIKKEGDVYVSDLTDEGAKMKVSFKMPDGSRPPVTDHKGSVKFFIKDGLLVKYEMKTKGKVDFFGNTFDHDRVTTVEIKDVETTKLEIPDDAKKHL